MGVTRAAHVSRSGDSDFTRSARIFCSPLRMDQPSATHATLASEDETDPDRARQLESSAELGKAFPVCSHTTPTAHFVGSLHLQSCSLDDYIAISSEYGKYDLVAGVLHAHPMPDHQHDLAVLHMLALFNERERKKATKFTAFPGPTVYIPAEKPTYLIPDLAVGVSATPIGTSTEVSFPAKHPPVLVVEVTSSNRKTDLIVKTEQYASAGATEYWIIDRLKGIKNSASKPAVHVGKRTGNNFNFKVYRGLQKISSSYFGDVSAVELLEPKDPKRVVKENVAKEKREVEQIRNQLERSKQEAERSKQEAEQLRKKLERSEKRRRKQKNILIAEGHKLSDSSPPSSPPRRRVRTITCQSSASSQ